MLTSYKLNPYTANENGVLDLQEVSGECDIFKELEKESNTNKDYIDHCDYNKDISALEKSLLSDSVKPDNFSTVHLKPISRLGWRPYTGDLPEQSIVSYQKAYETGHRIMLCDIRITSDGYMVCCHDDDISKVTAYDANGNKVSSGTVKISKTTLADILSYDFGKYKGYDGLEILQPEDFLKFCAKYNDITPVFELKTMTTEVLPELVALIKEYDFENNVIFLSSDAAIREEIATQLPDSIIGIWRYSINNGDIDSLSALDCAGKFIHVAKDGGEKGKASVNFENYVKCKAKGVDIGYTYIGSNSRDLFDEVKYRGILNYCKYLALDEVSWLYE